MKYFDPMFYLCSDKMPFSIKVETALKFEIKEKLLIDAVNTAIKRYPYFAIKVVKKSGELIAESNTLPVVVYKGDKIYPLGSKEVNYHMLALSYVDNKINFYITHVITDGAGLMPFIKTVLYYYLCAFLGKELPHEGIRLADDPFLDGERENPYPEEKMANAKPFYTFRQSDYFRIEDGGYVNDEIRTSYNFKAKVSDVMKFSRENDASPCAFFSSAMAKAIWSVHPNEQKDLISAISFNMRSGLNNQSSYRMLCNSLPIKYVPKLKGRAVRELCTCTRGSIMLQSQPENTLFYAERKKRELEKLLSVKGVKEKKEILSVRALKDSVDNTFSVSYVGKIDYGSIQEYIESVRNFTDGSTYKTLFIEISSLGEWFYVTLLQGFSCGVYYKALLEQLRESDIEFIEEGKFPIGTPDIILP